MTVSITVDFAVNAQSRAALDAAAYRLIGVAACQIDVFQDKWICRLVSRSPSAGATEPNAEDLRARFLDFVTDENLRESVAAKTDRVRDVILALAFGAIAGAAETKDK